MRNGPALACAVRILHDGWSIKLGENRPDRALQHLLAILTTCVFVLVLILSTYRTGENCTIISLPLVVVSQFALGSFFICIKLFLQDP